MTLFYSLCRLELCVAKLCLTLRPHGLCSLPGSFVHGILQARILEWIAIPFSKFGAVVFFVVCLLASDLQREQREGY